MSVLGGAGSGEVDVFTWGRECSLALFVYIYGECYVLVALVCHSLPCAYESTVVVGSVGIVNEIIIHTVAAQLVRVAIWVCSID